VVVTTHDDSSAIERFEPTPAGVNIHRLQAVVAQVLNAGFDIVDAKHEGVRTNDFHGGAVALRLVFRS
jgi:hypothetical protein